MAMNPARLACGLGVVLVIVTTATTALMTGVSVTPFVIGLAVWALVPYALVFQLTYKSDDQWVQTGAAFAVLAGEIYLRSWLFFVARSSTSSLLLLFSPLYLLVALAAGALLGWVLGLAWRRSGASGRKVIALTGAVCAAIAPIAIVRPDELPHRLGALVSVKVRIGRPRVVAGETFFKRSRLSLRQTGHVVGMFDDTAKEAIASIDDRGIVLLDPATGAEKSTIALSPEAHRQWNWFSRLVPDGAELVIVQTGGGYSNVEVLDLNGRRRWRFNPNAELPPIALLPADIDGDGQPEFFAASGNAVYRLNALGKVVWMRSVSGRINKLDVARAEQGRPACVMAVGSRRVWTWDADGRAQKELTLPDDDYQYRIVDWPRGRSLVGGGATLRAIDLNGQRLFEHALGDFRYHDAVTVRLDADGPPHLAVLGAASKEVGLWRLVVFSAAGEVVYDEILPQSARVMVAQDGGGRQQMLLLSDGKGRAIYRK